MSNELKPCPFCGGTKIAQDKCQCGPMGESLEHYEAKCECGASYWHPSLGVCNWNTRPIESRLERERDEARNELDAIRLSPIGDALRQRDEAQRALAAANAEIERLKAEAQEEELAFDLRHAADMRGCEMWRAANPDKPLTLPSHDGLVLFLITEVDRLTALVEAKADAKAVREVSGVLVDGGPVFIGTKLNYEARIICATMPCDVGKSVTIRPSGAKTEQEGAS